MGFVGAQGKGRVHKWIIAVLMKGSRSVLEERTQSQGMLEGLMQGLRLGLWLLTLICSWGCDEKTVLVHSCALIFLRSSGTPYLSVEWTRFLHQRVSLLPSQTALWMCWLSCCLQILLLRGTQSARAVLVKLMFIFSVNGYRALIPRKCGI